MKQPWHEKPTSECRGCGEPIRWVTFKASGKKMPVDADPSGAGTVVVDDEGMARRDLSYTGPKYVSHFETCEKRDDFRKR